MPTADSHCHASECWYEPIEALLEQMARSGVDHAILIQILGQYDNSYQAECVRRYPDRLRSVVIVDTSRPDAPAELERTRRLRAHEPAARIQHEQMRVAVYFRPA